MIRPTVVVLMKFCLFLKPNFLFQSHHLRCLVTDCLSVRWPYKPYIDLFCNQVLVVTYKRFNCIRSNFFYLSHLNLLFLEFCDTGCQTEPEINATVETEFEKCHQDSNTVNAESQTEPMRDIMEEQCIDKQQDTDDNVDKVRNISLIKENC